MHYPIAIEPGTDGTAFGVVVPDLPGCFSAGDTLDEAFANVAEAALIWLDTQETMPAPSPLSAIQSNPEFAGWIFGVIGV